MTIIPYCQSLTTMKFLNLNGENVASLLEIT